MRAESEALAIFALHAWDEVEFVPGSEEWGLFLGACARAGAEALRLLGESQRLRASKGSGWRASQAEATRLLGASVRLAEVSALPLEFLIPRLARGEYQARLDPAGDHGWSGYSLGGGSRAWGATYARSRLRFSIRINREIQGFGARFLTARLGFHRKPILTVA